jgi:hypothetical protein
MKKKTIGIILLTSCMVLFSCSKKTYSSSSKTGDGPNIEESYKRSKNGSQNTLSPYTEKHKLYLQKRYFGKE